MAEIYDLLRDDESKTYCFIDAETCNLCLNECHNLPWQISMIRIDGNKQTCFDYYIKWPDGIIVSADAARITHYNPEKVNEIGCEPEFVLEELNRELNRADLIGGHNLIGFDSYIIQAFYRKLGHKPYNIIPKVLDTFPIAKAIKLEIPFNKQTDNFSAWQYRMFHKRGKRLGCGLEALGKEYLIAHDYTTLHDALSDLKLNIKVWDVLKWQINL